MIGNIESIILFSENAQNLAKFYQEKVGLLLSDEAVMGGGGEESNIYFFNFGGITLSIVENPEVSGKNREPQRIIFNLETDDIEKEVKNLDSKGVKRVKDIYHLQEYGYIATFEDLDGNYFQVVQTKPTP